MKILLPFLTIIILVVFVFIGVEVTNLHLLFGVIIPYLAISVFIGGIIYRVIRWSCSPVPFCIPTTCGQQKSLSWIKQCRFENPFTIWQVVGRMILEVLLFRSLFRNTQAELRKGPHLEYLEEKLLWLFALVFHYSLLIVLIRHLRLFVEPIPCFVNLICIVDGFFQIGSPVIYLSSLTLLAGVIFLLIRRILIPKIHYISLSNDYFPLFLIIGIVISGLLMRYVTSVDIVGLKEFTVAFFSFKPVVPKDVSAIFYIHLFLVCVLLIYFPFSKLVHSVGIFLTPTRNMANNSRMKRHINPENYPVKIHTYQEYEDEFREKMKKVGIPVEKE